MLVDNARTSSVVTVFGRIAHRISHVTQTALIEQIDNELQLMEAFEISDFRLVSRFNQRLEGHFHQRADAAAKDGLLAEEIAFGFFFESRFDNARFEVACSPGVRESVLLGLTAGILMNG